MCECANVRMVAFVRAVIKALNHLHILTFAHLCIENLKNFPHVSPI